MKKLHRRSMVPSVVSDKSLSFLPAAILTSIAALTPADREILSYLISCSINFSTTADHHDPCFNCNCFRCYMKYWEKWNSSPNRHLIHEAIDAFEESLLKDKSISFCILNEPTSYEFDEDFVICEAESDDGDCNFPAAKERDIKKGGSVKRIARFLGQRIRSVLGS